MHRPVAQRVGSKAHSEYLLRVEDGGRYGRSVAEEGIVDQLQSDMGVDESVQNMPEGFSILRYASSRVYLIEEQ